MHLTLQFTRVQFTEDSSEIVSVATGLMQRLSTAFCKHSGGSAMSASKAAL